MRGFWKQRMQLLRLLKYLQKPKFSRVNIKAELLEGCRWVCWFMWTFQDLYLILWKATLHPPDSSVNNIFILLEGNGYDSLPFLRQKSAQKCMSFSWKRPTFTWKQAWIIMGGDIERHLRRHALKIVHGSDSDRELNFCIPLSLVILETRTTSHEWMGRLLVAKNHL